MRGFVPGAYVRIRWVPAGMPVRKLGVEEELLLIDPASSMLKPVSERAIDLHRPGSVERDLEHELFLQQIESATEPCHGVDELADALRVARRTAAKAAEVAGAATVAVGTPVLRDTGGDVTPGARYERMLGTYAAIGRQALACGMHVHVDVDSGEEGVGVIDRIRPWIPVLMAIAVNTPFHQGRDTGYASWRAHVWGSWPSAGPVEPFGDVAGYRAAVHDMVEFGAALDEGMVYFDVRLSPRYPTVEVRVCDVCTDVDIASLVSVVARALVQRAADDWRSGAPVATARIDLLRAARWRASRYGLSDCLLDPATRQLRPAQEVLNSLLRHIGAALEVTGETAYVREGLARLVRTGTGAQRQRRVAEREGNLSAVVKDLCRRTVTL